MYFTFNQTHLIDYSHSICPTSKDWKTFKARHTFQPIQVKCLSLCTIQKKFFNSNVILSQPLILNISNFCLYLQVLVYFWRYKRPGNKWTCCKTNPRNMNWNRYDLNQLYSTAHCWVNWIWTVNICASSKDCVQLRFEKQNSLHTVRHQDTVLTDR